MCLHSLPERGSDFGFGSGDPRRATRLADRRVPAATPYHRHPCTRATLAMIEPARRNAVLLLVLLSVIWSYNWIVMKQVLRYSGPFEFAAWRYALGTAVLF